MKSPEANDIIRFMVKDMMQLGYAYDSTFDGCYQMAIENYAYAVPDESKEEIIQAVKEILEYTKNM